MSDGNRIISYTTKLKQAAAFVGLACVLHIIGFSTAYWRRSNIMNIEVHYGLWKACICERSARCSCAEWKGYVPGFMKTVQAMECIGLIAVFLTELLILMQMCKMLTSKNIKTLSIALDAVAGVVILIGVIVFGVNVNYGLHFSFGLCIAAAVFCFIAIPLLVSDRTLVLSTRDDNATGQVTATSNTLMYSQQTPYVVNPAPQIRQSYGTQQVIPPSAPYGQIPSDFDEPPPYSAVVGETYSYGNPNIHIQEQK